MYAVASRPRLPLPLRHFPREAFRIKSGVVPVVFPLSRGEIERQAEAADLRALPGHVRLLMQAADFQRVRGDLGGGQFAAPLPLASPSISERIALANPRQNMSAASGPPEPGNRA